MNLMRIYNNVRRVYAIAPPYINYYGHHFIVSLLGIIGGLEFSRVLPFLNFYFQTKMHTPVYEDYDEISELIEDDNLEALRAHGWTEGRSCWLYIFADGTLGHCSPYDDLPMILIGLALSLLLAAQAIRFIRRFYRCKKLLIPPNPLLLHPQSFRS